MAAERGRRGDGATALTEAELIEWAARDGATVAFAELTRRHQAKIHALLLRLTRGNRPLAEDLAQETLLRAFRGLHGFEGRAQFGTWLHRIAYFVYLHHRNRTRPHGALPAELEATIAAPDDDLSAARVDLRRDVTSAVCGLPPRYRRVVEMHFVGHVPYRDIADALGLPIGTVKTQLHRAKLMMREAMAGWGSTTIAMA